jgi:hypothetical protein
MKITFNTLKKFARRGQLKHQIKRTFDGSIDGLQSYSKLTTETTTLDDLKNFKVYSGNYISEENGTIKLTNCCYRIDFHIEVA